MGGVTRPPRARCRSWSIGVARPAQAQPGGSPRGFGQTARPPPAGAQFGLEWQIGATPRVAGRIQEIALSKTPKEAQQTLAEAKFKRKELQARDGAKAMAEYEASQVATRAKTAKLRALREAKEAEDSEGGRGSAARAGQEGREEEESVSGAGKSRAASARKPAPRRGPRRTGAG